MFTLILVIWTMHTNIFMPTMTVPGFMDKKSCIQYGEKYIDVIIKDDIDGRYMCVNQQDEKTVKGS